MTETLRDPGWGWAWLAASSGGSWPGHSDVVVMGIRLRACSSGCSSAGPCGFARVCPMCNCIMIVIIVDITDSW